MGGGTTATVFLIHYFVVVGQPTYIWRILTLYGLLGENDPLRKEKLTDCQL